ncbi:hypothetical protein C8D94_1011122 [Marinirhabdus gelatinilytica]|uniref:Uncharacterized protein n=1 Tax=Marinirhabdus gelatinilytica TaxID=1703343 RepID=A0A370QLK5_9FLAO|nr:hypothetical protein C8D94_1011122 [Marinirhabdus gelatinilytica]
MSVFQIAVLGVVFFLCAVSVIIFRIQRKRLHHLHLGSVRSLEGAISKNQGQIRLRSDTLKNYDFLRQNISEVLMVQKEIEVAC